MKDLTSLVLSVPPLEVQHEIGERFRAFDKATGELLWETQLPAAGYATPSVYEVAGRQYVVIAAGGGKLGTASGDAYIAFALPD
jgi:quinoprotein glucose dehydrogenase